MNIYDYVRERNISYFPIFFKLLKFVIQFKLFYMIQMFSNYSYISTNLDFVNFCSLLFTFVYLCLPSFKWRICAQILCLFYFFSASKQIPEKVEVCWSLICEFKLSGIFIEKERQGAIKMQKCQNQTLVTFYEILKVARYCKNRKTWFPHWFSKLNKIAKPESSEFSGLWSGVGFSQAWFRMLPSEQHTTVPGVQQEQANLTSLGNTFCHFYIRSLDSIRSRVAYNKIITTFLVFRFL